VLRENPKDRTDRSRFVPMPPTNNCLFCSIPAERVIRENSLAYAIFDAFPVVPQHALVIPRRHAETYFDLTKEELLACDALLRELRSELTQKDPSIEGFNIGMNAGRVAGQTVFHCHIHLLPRRAGDIEGDPRGGVRHMISGKGYYDSKK
jgi:diadenosine tetraphosphate (Ap4A) HIT family hydrolase